jgi:hypothetical protein
MLLLSQRLAFDRLHSINSSIRLVHTQKAELSLAVPGEVPSESLVHIAERRWQGLFMLTRTNKDLLAPASSSAQDLHRRFEGPERQ